MDTIDTLLSMLLIVVIGRRVYNRKNEQVGDLFVSRPRQGLSGKTKLVQQFDVLALEFLEAVGYVDLGAKVSVCNRRSAVVCAAFPVLFAAYVIFDFHHFTMQPSPSSFCIPILASPGIFAETLISLQYIIPFWNWNGSQTVSSPVFSLVFCCLSGHVPIKDSCQIGDMNDVRFVNHRAFR